MKVKTGTIEIILDKKESAIMVAVLNELDADLLEKVEKKLNIQKGNAVFLVQTLEHALGLRLREK